MLHQLGDDFSVSIRLELVSLPHQELLHVLVVGNDACRVEGKRCRIITLLGNDSDIVIKVLSEGEAHQLHSLTWLYNTQNKFKKAVYLASQDNF